MRLSGWGNTTYRADISMQGKPGGFAISAFLPGPPPPILVRNPLPQGRPTTCPNRPDQDLEQQDPRLADAKGYSFAVIQRPAPSDRLRTRAASPRYQHRYQRGRSSGCIRRNRLCRPLPHGFPDQWPVVSPLECRLPTGGPLDGADLSTAGADPADDAHMDQGKPSWPLNKHDRAAPHPGVDVRNQHRAAWT